MILLVEKELAHYRIPAFARLDARLEGELLVLHGEPPPGSGLATTSSDLDVPFRHRCIRNYWMAGGRVYAQNLMRILAMARRSRAVILRHSIRNLGLLPLARCLQALNVPVVLWGQGFSKNRVFDPESNVADRLHLAVVRSGDAYVCYGEEIRRTLGEYVPNEMLYVARNTLDVESLVRLHDQLEAQGRERVKERLGLECSHYLCFSGRLQPRKRLHELLDVYVSVRRDYGVDAGLLIVGAGPERSSLEQRVRNDGIAAVEFLGALYGEQVDQYLFASDVMVVPGAIGLAAVHGFALGLSVVGRRSATERIGHGPEATYLDRCPAGFMVGGASVRALAEATVEAIQRTEELRKEARRFAEEELSLKRMIEGFLRAIRHAEGLHDRPGCETS